MKDLIARLNANPLETLRGALRAEPPTDFQRDEFDLYPEMRPRDQKEALEASVLIPLIARRASQDGPVLLFTRRTETLTRHSGQVSFPGGRRDDGDVSPVQTALRETMEETGIDPAFVSIAGFLPRYRTGTGFNILPVVGVLSEGFTLTPDPREVAEIFEVPLAYFLDPANRIEEDWQIKGRTRRVYAFRPATHNIWGITAALVSDFTTRLLATENAMNAP